MTETIAELAAAVRGICPSGSRVLLGIAGAPGAGKTTLAEALVAELGARAASVPMDGFHLADVSLERLGLLGRKGAPETFDAHGYARLLRTLRERPAHTVFAPGFERDLEQPLAAAIGVDPDVEVIITEGNYLLLDAWAEARAELDAVWFVQQDAAVRRSRLIARHEQFGKSPAAARAWVEAVDEPNARLVEATATRADRVIRLDDERPG
ncbi:hypothetical protein SAMN04489806_1501 [Paramicrobacterium humi]|uniref:Panthothenate kinase n=1 Tax=Paramicrobacterium humi TaxID=640635 RepID=A0A1H4LCN3_9MICO|nr:nucleoside/nucleotide kinase family protein [Microbacterium humi]SEB68501.1 hypothetical protein SAMN04489806_1501 [Microbacterium humi]